MNPLILIFNLCIQWIAMPAQPEVIFPYEFDPEKRRKSKLYMKQKLITGLLNGFVVPLVFYLLLLFSGLAGFISNWSASISPLFAIPIFMFVLITLTELVEFPLGFYSSFVFEHKYQLSNYTLQGWFKDFFKELLLTYVISIPLYTAIFLLFSKFSLWWVLAWILLMAFSVFMQFIFPVVIFPFFYKTEPWQDQVQTNALLAMVKRAGVKNIDRVLLAKESEKSKKPNAMFAGLGKTKTIVLFDTLVDNFTSDEVETVVGHELGHYVQKDNLRFLIIEAVTLLPSLFIINLVLQSASAWPGFSLALPAVFPLFLLCSMLIEFVLNPFVNSYSRKRELACDLFGLEMARKPWAQISTEKRLADMSLVDHLPDPWIERLFYTHPASQKRIDLCYDWAEKNNIKLE